MPSWAQSRQHLGFGVARPQGVLVLHCGQWLHCVGAPDGLRADLGQPEVRDLAGVDELPDGTSDVFDRHIRVDAVLVEQVDAICAQPYEHGVHDVADVVGTAVETCRTPVASMANPNLVAMTTWSRNGASASPTSSSLTNGP